MNNFNPYLAALLIISLLQILTSPAATFSNKGLETEEKARLGSTPPSCHNKCNQCHPCFVVQVSTLPSNYDRIKQSSTTDKYNSPSSSSSLMKFYYLAGPGNRYSNYKPLGWKCRCNNHFYNP